jgi:hypothetical protein
MGDEVIVPSWEDAANRWMDAYGEQRERAEAAEAELAAAERRFLACLDVAEARCAALKTALRDTADELSRWGMGDMHYGINSGQEARVSQAVDRARALLESPTGEHER